MAVWRPSPVNTAFAERRSTRFAHGPRVPSRRPSWRAGRPLGARVQGDRNGRGRGMAATADDDRGSRRLRGHGGRRSCVPGEPGGPPGRAVLGPQGTARRAEGGDASPARRHCARSPTAPKRVGPRPAHPGRAPSRLQQHREPQLGPAALPRRPGARATGNGVPQGDLGSRGPHGRAHARQDDVYATGGDI